MGKGQCTALKKIHQTTQNLRKRYFLFFIQRFQKLSNSYAYFEQVFIDVHIIDNFAMIISFLAQLCSIPHFPFHLYPLQIL